MYQQAEDVIDFDEQWPETIVCYAAMANLQYSQGQNSMYDDYTIVQHLQSRLVDQKPLLDVSHLMPLYYDQFPYDLMNRTCCLDLGQDRKFVGITY